MTNELYQYLLHIPFEQSCIGGFASKSKNWNGHECKYLRTGTVNVFWSNLWELRAIEVGVFTGCSSLCVALALPEHGVLTACDVSEEWTAVARRLEKAGVDTKIDLRLAPALGTLQALLEDGLGEKIYDFAFIDADKENYDLYYEGLSEILRSGGLILLDNVLWGGKDWSAIDDIDTESIRIINQVMEDLVSVHVALEMVSRS